MTSVPALFRSTASQAVYRRLLASLERLGPFTVETKKTCVHVCHGRAFLGVHPRATGLLVNIVTEKGLRSPRVRKSEALSARRWQNHVLIESPADVDAELLGWFATARALCEK